MDASLNSGDIYRTSVLQKRLVNKQHILVSKIEAEDPFKQNISPSKLTYMQDMDDNRDELN